MMFSQIGGRLMEHSHMTSFLSLCVPDLADSSRRMTQGTLLRSSAEDDCCDLLLSACMEKDASAYAAEVGNESSAECCLSSRNEILSAFVKVPPSVLHGNNEGESSPGEDLVQEDIDYLGTFIGCSAEEEKSSGSALRELVYDFDPSPAVAVFSPGFVFTVLGKRGCEELGEDEVESRFNKRLRSEEAAVFQGNGSSPDVSTLGTASGDISQPPSDGRNCEDDCCLDQSAHELQMLCDDFGFEMSDHECSSYSKEADVDSGSSGSARESRRQKIKETVKLLRDVIPGGDCIDTAIVLDEAIHYVKLLQLQVQTLGAKRLAERAAR